MNKTTGSNPFHICWFAQVLWMNLSAKTVFVLAINQLWCKRVGSMKGWNWSCCTWKKLFLQKAYVESSNVKAEQAGSMFAVQLGIHQIISWKEIQRSSVKEGEEKDEGGGCGWRDVLLSWEWLCSYVTTYSDTVMGLDDVCFSGIH